MDCETNRSVLPERMQSKHNLAVKSLASYPIPVDIAEKLQVSFCWPVSLQGDWYLSIQKASRLLPRYLFDLANIRPVFSEIQLRELQEIFARHGLRSNAEIFLTNVERHAEHLTTEQLCHIRDQMDRILSERLNPIVVTADCIPNCDVVDGSSCVGTSTSTGISANMTVAPTDAVCDSVVAEAPHPVCLPQLVDSQSHVDPLLQSEHLQESLKSPLLLQQEIETAISKGLQQVGAIVAQEALQAEIQAAISTSMVAVGNIEPEQKRKVTDEDAVDSKRQRISDPQQTTVVDCIAPVASCGDGAVAGCEDGVEDAGEQICEEGDKQTVDTTLGILAYGDVAWDGFVPTGSQSTSTASQSTSRPKVGYDWNERQTTATETGLCLPMPEPDVGDGK
jgi:hypothetical protein